MSELRSFDCAIRFLGATATAVEMGSVIFRLASVTPHAGCRQKAAISPHNLRGGLETSAVSSTRYMLSLDEFHEDPAIIKSCMSAPKVKA